MGIPIVYLSSKMWLLKLCFETFRYATLGPPNKDTLFCPVPKFGNNHIELFIPITLSHIYVSLRVIPSKSAIQVNIQKVLILTPAFLHYMYIFIYPQTSELLRHQVGLLL